LNEEIKVPEGWEVVSFEKSGISLIDGDRGKNYPKRGDFSDIGYCLFLNTKNVPGRKFDFSVKQFISKEKDSLLGKGKLTRNDIVMTTRGTVGNVALYDEKVPFEHIRINSGMLIIRADKKEFDSKYLFYYMTSPFFKKEIKGLSTGTAQPQLPIKNLRKALVIKPPLSEQEKIAEILGSIDDEIENLMEQNKTLEEIAKTIFKRWFIDFEFPNEEGKPYKSSGGEFVDSELGKIPKGWRVGKLGEVIKKKRNRIKSFEEWKNKKLISLSNMPNFSMCITSFGKGEELKSNIFKLDTYDLLYGSIRPYFGKAGFSSIDGVVAGTVFQFIPMKKIYFSFALLTITSRTFIEYTVSHSKGTKMPIIGIEDILNYRIAIPNEKLTMRLNEIIFPLIERMKNNIAQIQTLTQLRDTLLPKLITGEIRVKV
jgi:type I restriction enzyme S subunit